MSIQTGQNATAADVAAIVPPGVVFPYAGSSAPAGYLLCDGTAISRTTYAALFAIIGTNYGVGDGATTFNLPDLRGRIPLGKDNMGGSSANRVTDAAADSLGGAGGSETHTLTTSELPAHNHRIANSASGGGGSSDLITTSVSANANEAYANGTNNQYIENSGGGQAHANVQPYMTFNYIIRYITYT
jgi:microcystin-dependent protein